MEDDIVVDFAISHVDVVVFFLVCFSSIFLCKNENDKTFDEKTKIINQKKTTL